MVARKLFALAIVGVLATSAFAQYPKSITGFEEFDDGEAALFRSPLLSGSTVGYDQEDPAVEPDGIWATNPEDPEPPWSRSQVQNDGGYNSPQALEIYFIWGNPADTDDPPGYSGDPYTGENDFVRCTTYMAPNLDRPSLHLGGKVKFKIAVLGYLDENYTPAPDASLLVTLGIRETGKDLPQGYTDISGGDIEWVYPGDGLIPADTNGPLPFPAYPGGWRVPATTVWPPPASDWHEVTIDLTNPYALRGFADNGDSIITCGDGVLDATMVGDGVNRGSLEHIGFTNDPTDTTGKTFFVYIDDLEFEAPVADPALPPTIVSPLILGDTEVTVTDIQSGATNVSLYKNDVLLASQGISTTNDVEFVIAPAVENDVYTATQTVNGNESPMSIPVTVYPAPSPFTFATVIDETGGGSCSADEWEWVGAYSVSGTLAAAQGQPLFANSAVWQTIEIPFNDPELVHASLGGDGVLAPSPTGFYTFDTWWWSIAPGATEDILGPWEVFVDTVQEIDEFGNPSTVLMNMENLEANRLLNPRGQSTVSPSSRGKSSLAAYDGEFSYRITWTFGSTDSSQALGMLERLGYTCNTSIPFSDTVSAIRFRMLVRETEENPDVALPVVVGPIVLGYGADAQDTVQISDIDDDANTVQLLINGVPFGTPIVPTGSTADVTGLTLSVGDSISAVQDVGTNGMSDPAYPKVVAEKPVPPLLEGLLMPDDLEVIVTGVSTTPHASASTVIVYVNDIERGTATVDSVKADVTVTLTSALVKGDIVTATQVVNGAESDPSNAIEVNFGIPQIYYVPANGDSTIRVYNVSDTSDEVRIINSNGTVHGTYVPVEGDTDVLVPVTGLIAGQQIYAEQRITTGGIVASPPSPFETVTSSMTTDVMYDDFEYASQSALQSSWELSSDYWLTLSSDANSTPGGLKSLLRDVTGADSSGDNMRIEKALSPTVTGTAEEPIIWSVCIYDGGGAGSLDNQWVDMMQSSWTLLEVGMATSGFSPSLSSSYYALRANGNGGPGWIPMNAVAGSRMRSEGWHTYTLVLKGTAIDAYVDGILTNKNISLSSPWTLATARIGTAYGAAAAAYYDDLRLQTGKLGAMRPACPTVASPIEAGDTEVVLEDIVKHVSLVSVYADGVLIGSVDPAGADTVAVPVSPALVHLQKITATTSNAAGESFKSAPLEVGIGNSDLLICVGVRDENGNIEWIGASQAINDAPQGKPISVSENWQTITFDPTSDPILGFVGDGVIDGTSGSLEHIAVTVPASSANRSSGAWHLFVDNVRNVGATPELISDFEGYETYSEVMFQEPGYSGTTAKHLAGSPNYSSNQPIGNPGSSQLLSWFWKDTTDQRWARITTSGTAILGSPAIDLTKPIQMDVLLHPAGIPDITPDPVDVTDVTSMAMHGATEYGIQVYPPSMINNRPYTCEPRYGLSANKLEIGLSDVITDASGITVTATNTSSEVVSATVALDPAGDKLIATFSPKLANKKIYTIDVAGDAVNDFQCEYVVLVGNLTNGGPQMNTVNAFDKSLVIARLGATIPTVGPNYDIANSGPSAGIINAFDKSMVIARLNDVAD